MKVTAVKALPAPPPVLGVHLELMADEAKELYRFLTFDRNERMSRARVCNPVAYDLSDALEQAGVSP